jgi:hypothetical protein
MVGFKLLLQGNLLGDVNKVYDVNFVYLPERACSEPHCEDFRLDVNFVYSAIIAQLNRVKHATPYNHW